MKLEQPSRLLFLVASAFTLFMALSPKPPHMPTDRFGDKFEHVLAFATLTFLARLAFPRASAGLLPSFFFSPYYPSLLSPLSGIRRRTRALIMPTRLRLTPFFSNVLSLLFPQALKAAEAFESAAENPILLKRMLTSHVTCTSL